MYVITGATGNTGKPIALSLLEAGKQVRVIGRSADKAKELTDKGAEFFVAEITDTAALTKAFEGAEAVYCMIPPFFTAEDFTAYQKQASDAMAEAIIANGVKYAVTLSSIGAHRDADTGVIIGLNYLENRLNRIEGLNVLHLRPAYFMENTLGMIGLIKGMGIMGSPVKADMPFPAVATQDIAAYAAKRLAALDFSGSSVAYLLGTRDVTYKEIASVYGAAIGKEDLQYMEFPYAAAKESMMRDWGLSESMADNMLAFMQAFNEGRILDDPELRRDEHTTTPTSIEAFSHTFRYVYSL